MMILLHSFLTVISRFQWEINCKNFGPSHTKKIFKKHLQSWFKDLWYQNFFPYDLRPEINNFKCKNTYDDHSRGFRSFFGWFLAILAEPIPKMVVFQKNEKFNFLIFLLWKWVEWPGLGKLVIFWAPQAPKDQDFLIGSVSYSQK